MSPKPSCQLIGAGRAGRALARAMTAAGYRFTWVGSLHRETAGRLAEEIGCADYGVGFEGFPLSSGEEGVGGEVNFIIIAVPDNWIAQVASEVAAAGVIGEGTIVTHLSGALGSDVLHAARSAGASVMAFHPAQTLTPWSDPGSVFKGICADMEGDVDACRFGEQLARDLGARAVELRPEQRIVTHLAMTVGSNFTVAIVRMAEDIMKSAGIDHETIHAMLMPLFRQTAQNIGASGTGVALTGPIARGDSTVIRKHLTALAHMNDTYSAIYRAVARLIVQMSSEQGNIPESVAVEVRRILSALEKK